MKLMACIMLSSLWFLPAVGMASEEPAVAVAEADPFAVTDTMRKTLQKMNTGAGFVPAKSPQTVPFLRLKGYIEDKDRIPTALLEIEKSDVYLVREGDTVSLQSAEKNVVLKIEKITNQSVWVKVGTLGEMVIIR